MDTSYSLFALCINKATLDGECLFPHGVNPSIKGAAPKGGKMLSEGSKVFPLRVPL